MADLKERLALQIAGFANLVSQKGCLVCGDGEQSTYLTTTGVPDGYVLSKDSTTLEGLKWIAGGGSSLAFTDGVTNTAGTVRNDLVTGVAVTKVDAEVPGSNDNAFLKLNADGTVQLRSADNGAGRENLTITGGVVLVLGEGGATVNGTQNHAILTNDTNSVVRVNGSSGSVELTAAANNSDITLNAPDRFQSTTDKVILTATGAAGTWQGTADTSMTLRAGNGGVSGTLNLLNDIGAVNLTATTLLSLAGSGISIVSDVASQLVLGSGANTLIDAGGNIIASAGGNFTFDADIGSNGTVRLTADGTGNFLAQAGTGVGANARLEAKGGQEFIQLSGGGSSSNKITIQADGTGSNGVVVVSGSSGVQINGNAGNVQLTTPPATGDIVLNSGVGLDFDAAGLVDITAGGSIGLTATDAVGLHAGALGMVLDTTGVGDIAINASHDETHTVGRNLTMTVAGSGGADLSTTVGNFVIDAGTTDQTAEVRLMPRGSAPASTLTFRIWDGPGASQMAYSQASGGSVVDVEARVVLNALINQMSDWGWVAAPT